MKLGRSDLKKLRWQLAAAICLIAAAGAVAYLSSAATKVAESEHRSAAARHAEVDTRLRQVRIEEEEIKSRAALFLHLQEHGILGKEKRLDWVEMLRDIQRRLRLPDMSYEFAPQKPMEDNGGDHAFFFSPMKLHLRLVHEEDLLNFLDKIQSEAGAIVLTRSCNVVRNIDNGTGRLTADCELAWVTATAHSGGGGR